MTDKIHTELFAGETPDKLKSLKATTLARINADYKGKWVRYIEMYDPFSCTPHKGRYDVFIEKPDVPKMIGAVFELSFAA